MKLLLASTSIYRKNLLTRAGYRFQAEAPLADEEALKIHGPSDPQELTRFLALKKAESLMNQFSDYWIVGSDQAAILDNVLLHKPKTRERAIAQLTQMSARTHHLITSMAILRADCPAFVFTDVTSIRFRKLSLEEIESYLDRDQPFDCAGSYKFEKGGITLIENIETKDPTAIEGLPVIALTSFFIEKGFSLSTVI
jgi:septum formation protein